MRLAMSTAKILVPLFAYVASLGHTAPLHAQTALRAEGLPQASSAKSRKSPMLARVLGIFPGLGHFYAGEAGRGTAVAGAFVTVLLISEVMGVEDCETPLLGPSDCPPMSTEELLVGVAGLGVVGFSIWDAGRAAKRTNLRDRVGDVRIRPTLSVGPRAPSAGLTMAVSFR